MTYFSALKHLELKAIKQKAFSGAPSWPVTLPAAGAMTGGRRDGDGRSDLGNWMGPVLLPLRQAGFTTRWGRGEG